MPGLQYRSGRACHIVEQHIFAHRAVSLQARPARPAVPTCSAAPPERPEPAGTSSIPSASNESASRTISRTSPSLSDPVQTIYWGGTLPSTRRAILGTLSGAAIALGGNLGGVTSWLLGLDGGTLARGLRADVVVPILGAKRCVDYTYGFEFTYPASWLGDQTLAYRAAKRAEAARGPLPPTSRGRRFSDGDDPEYDDANFPPLSTHSSSSSTAAALSSSPSAEAVDAAASRGSTGGGRAGAGGPGGTTVVSRPRPAVAEPVAAFGPPGTTGEENISVIVAPITPGFTLESLGDPRAAGERLLTSLAPEGSGLQAMLLGATGRTTTAASTATGRPAGPTSQLPLDEHQHLYYTLEYTIRGPRFFRHNVSVYTARNDLLYTLNAQCPQARWQQDAEALLAAAASFKLL